MDKDDDKLYDLFERIENDRAEADYQAAEGRDGEAVITLTLDDCDTLSRFLLEAYGVSLKAPGGHGHICDLLATASGAFAGSV